MILFGQIIETLERWHLIVRQVAELTGIAAADFSRVCDVKLDQYAMDRILTVLGRLGQQVDVNVKVPANVEPAA